MVLEMKPFAAILALLAIMVSLSFLANGVSCFEEKKLLTLQMLQWQQKSTGSSSCASQKSRSEKGATILELKHKDYCSGKTIDQESRLILDNLHVQYLQSRIKNIFSGNTKDISNTEIPLNSGIRLQTLNYIATIELGGRKMTVIVDTGSDLTWVQCQPCKSCYNQQDPVFNPLLSPSYKKVLCNSSTCQALEFAAGISGVCSSNPPACNYFVSYGDGSYTRGELGCEHLCLGTASVKNDFIFGCGRNNKGLFGGVSGLMGLGKSDLSLVSQTSEIFGGIFSYCLPSTQDPGASGSLILGWNSSVLKNSTPITFTKMIPNPQLPTFYFLNLTGISIGGKQLQVSGFAKGGILIDSGTVITRLPPSIYNALKAEFLKQFSGFPSAPGFSILDTCFNFSAYRKVDIPWVKLEFEGNAEMTVDVTGIFYFVKSDASLVCLALASLSHEDETGIIGNYQQKNQRVIYDTKNSQLGFAGEACSSM